MGLGTRLVPDVIDFHHVQHLEALNTARKLRVKAKEQDYMLQFESIILTFSPDRQRAIQRALKGKTSTWLTVLPLQKYHFDLSPMKFRDGLAICYLRDPPCLPPRCDGCGATLSHQHALDC